MKISETLALAAAGFLALSSAVYAAPSTYGVEQQTDGMEGTQATEGGAVEAPDEEAPAVGPSQPAAPAQAAPKGSHPAARGGAGGGGFAVPRTKQEAAEKASKLFINAPTSGGSPVGGTCNPKPKPESEYRCGNGAARFFNDVDAAIDLAVARAPQYLDLEDEPWTGCFMVKDNRFFGVVQQVLKEHGYCTYYDGEELAVKKGDSYNEQYDIHLSNGHLRRGRGSFIGACTPAWF